MATHKPNLELGIEEVLAILENVNGAHLWAILDMAPRAGDALTGIVIAKLGISDVAAADGQLYGFYAASIHPGNHVNPHVHARGHEPYVVRAGEGVMHLGTVEASTVTWQAAFRVQAGSEVIVGEHEVHSLENTGSEPLDFAFACPRAHLTEEDRVFTMDLTNGLPQYQ